MANDEPISVTQPRIVETPQAMNEDLVIVSQPPVISNAPANVASIMDNTPTDEIGRVDTAIFTNQSTIRYTPPTEAQLAAEHADRERRFGGPRIDRLLAENAVSLSAVSVEAARDLGRGDFTDLPGNAVNALRSLAVRELQDERNQVLAEPITVDWAQSYANQEMGRGTVFGVSVEEHELSDVAGLTTNLGQLRLNGGVGLVNDDDGIPQGGFVGIGGRMNFGGTPSNRGRNNDDDDGIGRR